MAPILWFVWSSRSEFVALGSAGTQALGFTAGERYLNHPGFRAPPFFVGSYLDPSRSTYNSSLFTALGHHFTYKLRVQVF